MAGSLILVLTAGVVRLACGVAWSWLQLRSDRARRRSLEVLARTVGAEATMMDRSAYGDVLAIWTRDAGKGHHEYGGIQ